MKPLIEPKPAFGVIKASIDFPIACLKRPSLWSISFRCWARQSDRLRAGLPRGKLPPCMTSSFLSIWSPTEILRPACLQKLCLFSSVIPLPSHRCWRCFKGSSAESEEPLAVSVFSAACGSQVNNRHQNTQLRRPRRAPKRAAAFPTV